MPGSGYVWKNKQRKYNKYDYTKHEITKKELPMNKDVRKVKVCFIYI